LARLGVDGDAVVVAADGRDELVVLGVEMDVHPDAAGHVGADAVPADPRRQPRLVAAVLGLVAPHARPPAGGGCVRAGRVCGGCGLWQVVEVMSLCRKHLLCRRYLIWLATWSCSGCLLEEVPKWASSGSPGR